MSRVLHSALVCAAVLAASSGVTGCHLIFPFDPMSEAVGDGCQQPGKNYSAQITKTVGCNGGLTCALWDDLCLDQDHQYVVLHHNPQKRGMETYGLCNVDSQKGVLRCRSGVGSVLTIDSAGTDTLSGGDDFSGTWTLLHRDMSQQLLTTGKGCTASTCKIFGSVLNPSVSVRHHLRRVVGDVAQWYSFCTVGDANNTAFKVTCDGLRMDTAVLQRVIVRNNETEMMPDGSSMQGVWTLYTIQQNTLQGPTDGCDLPTCSLWNKIAISLAAPYSVVHYDDLSRHWYQLCSGKEMGSTAPELVCYNAFAKGPISIDANGSVTNKQGSLINNKWTLLREP